MKCGQLLSQDLRKGQPNNTVEEPDQDNHHSVRSLTGTNSASAFTQTVDATNDRVDITAVDIPEFSTLTDTQVINTLLNSSLQAENTIGTTHLPDTDHQPTHDRQPLQVRNEIPKERIKWPSSNMKKNGHSLNQMQLIV